MENKFLLKICVHYDNDLFRIHSHLRNIGFKFEADTKYKDSPVLAIDFKNKTYIPTSIDDFSIEISKYDSYLLLYNNLNIQLTKLKLNNLLNE